MNDTYNKLIRLLRYYWKRLRRRFSLSSSTNFVGWLSICALCLFFTMGVEYLHYRSSLQTIKQDEITRVLRQKEMLSEQIMTQIRHVLAIGNVSDLYDRDDLYEISKSNEISFLVYKGNELLFWTNNDIAIQGVEGFDFAKEFYYLSVNAHVIVMQSFYKEYRCISLIKIKDYIFPKKNSCNNYFAEAFHLPGSVVISGDPSQGMSFYSKDDMFLFSLSDILVKSGNYRYILLSILFGSLFLISLAMTLNSLANNIRIRYPKWYRYGLIGVFLLLILTFCLLLYFRFPGLWFDNAFLSGMSYHSDHIPSSSHLSLFVTFLYGIAFLYKRQSPYLNIDILKNKKPWKKTVLIFIIKSFPFVLMVQYFLIVRGMVYHSNMNVAVSFIQEVNAETLIMLMLELFLVYLFYFVISHIRVLYAFKENTKIILFVHITLTVLVSLCYAVQGLWVEVVFVFLVSIVILFVDLYETYYPVSRFLYTAPIAFVFINLIVGLSYYYSTSKNESNYRAMAKNISENSCVYKDEVAESILKDKNSYLITDTRLIRWVRLNSSEVEDLAENYLWESYFRIFDEKYDFEVQVCSPSESLYLRKPNFENVVYKDFSEVEDHFRRLDKSRFYANQDERLAISFLGRIPMDSITVYLKFYRKSTYDRVSLLEQSLTEEKNYVNYSMAKYINGELSYSDGEFHYPIMMTWIPGSNRGEDDKFFMNYYTHYVHVFDQGKSIAVVSVPERQSYIYVIMLTYLFASYILVALAYFSICEMRKSFQKRGKSLLTRMQLIFVIPILISFMIFAFATFPFFMDQYEKLQFSEMKEKSVSIQQQVQQLVGLDETITMNTPELFAKVRELSNLFQLDIVLYDERGNLAISSRPILLPSDKRRSKLVYPRIKFLQVPDLFMVEKFHSVNYYSQYMKAYNLQNKCVGYIHMMSYKSYYEARNEMLNILVVVVDVYLFISIISIFIIWLLNKQTIRPLSLLSQHFTQVRLTGENSLIDYREDDEIGDVVKQYNTMVKQLHDSADKLARSEREFAWREMARRIAHEIKNPLTPMKLSVQQCLRKQKLDPENFDLYFQKTANILVDQIDNLSNIASEFSSFAKASESRCVKMDMVERLQSTVELFVNNSEDVYFVLELNGIDHLYVWMDDKQMLQVMNNLFRNAIQAIPSDRKGVVQISLHEEDGFACIDVKDNGCGIPEQNRQYMFQPNFTTKTSGMGLGLAIVKNILLSAGGDIDFESKINEGTTFFLRIPIYKD